MAKLVSKLSIVIPVYNERSTIGEVLSRVDQVTIPGVDLEVVVADDGSNDGSPEIIEEFRRSHTRVTQVHTSLINLGKGAAIRFGLEYVTGDVVIIQDADLELDPNEYDKLIAPIVAGQADVVYGTRFKFRQSNVPRTARLANRFLVLLTNLLYGSNLTDMETAYKVFRTEVIRSLRLRAVSFDFEPEVTAKLLLAGYKIHEVPITYNPRTVQQGKKIGWTDGVDAIYTLLKYRFVSRR